MEHKKSFDLKPVFMVAGLVLLMLMFYGVSQLQSGDRRLIPLSVFALLAGLFFEAKQLYENWSKLFLTALGSFAFSLFVFLPGKHEEIYVLENHIEMWPYFFIFWFALFTITAHKDKTIARLTEGITLLQSIAVLYWIIDLHIYEINSSFVKFLMVIGLIFSAFSLFNAFTPFILSRTTRLTLSIWSCIIMVLLAADNIYSVYQNVDIESVNSIPLGLLIGLEYFLLGICAIYILQNFLMLMGFLPGRGTFFNAEYFRDLKELKNDHIKRYSDKQVHFFHSLFCVVITVTAFYLNYHYKVLPRNLAIWVVFVTFPFILNVFDFVTQRHRR